MSLHKEYDYTEKIRDIKGVQFSVLSPEEIKKRSVVHVTETILYDNNGDPVINGLFDARMGVIDHGKICPTDGLDNRFCPGYFGHIELAKPVFHTQFMDIILLVLKTTCVKCSNLLLDLENKELLDYILSLPPKKRLNYIINNTKNKVCGLGHKHSKGCGAIQPDKYTKEGLTKIIAVWKGSMVADLKEEDKKQVLTAEIIYKLFRRITDEHCKIIGLNPKWCRPDWLICVNLPVPPPSVRPSVKQSNEQRSEDDITHKLIDIIKTNNLLKKKMQLESSLETTIDEWANVLQYNVSTLIDNNLPGINPSTHRSGRPLKTIRERLKGKEGRIRGNLMGKRVDFSARSVITPDPNLKINELGVPFKIAMNLTVPEEVNKYNILQLTLAVRNGPFKHPGAKSIKKKKDNRTTSLLHVDTSSIELNEGDIVHRHLKDGDTVLFNRQPSLHKMSMMAHNVKVMDHYTFRLNVSVTTPYNADFDGDEMNMHVPQSLQTAIELEKIALVPLQIISPREHSPIITLVQDTLLGINRLTNDSVYFTRNEMMNILLYIKTFDGNLPEPSQKSPERWTGRQLFSMILPKDLNINMKNKSHKDSGEDKLNHVIIKNGELIQGRIDKKILNTGSRGIIHVIFNDYGYKTAQKFLDDIQNIVTRFLVITGFSVGISDLISNKETDAKIEKTILSKKKEVSKMVQLIHSRSIDNTGSDTIKDNFEKNVNNILNKAIAEAGQIGLKNLSQDNRMTNMVSAGSKGKEINIAQMVACLGQQNVDGKRIPNGFNNRTLPHFSKYDISPESKGFVENSFIKGLSPQEFFFHAMGGREGLIDTAVKTAETGYIQRKLIKAMEDLKIFYDLSVRNAEGNIVQFLYGEDGFHFCKIESQFIDYFQDNYEEIERKHRFEHEENWSSFLTNPVVKEMTSNKKYKSIVDNYFNQLISDYNFVRGYVFRFYSDKNINIPINLFRLINNTKHNFRVIGSNKSNVNPLYIINEIEKLINDLKINRFIGCSKMFEIFLRLYLSPKVLIKTHNISKLGFDYIINTIKLKFGESKIEPNEMVGPIAAQSIGEPATQMTLNTFHFAGVSSKSNVTRGVPRLKELLHLSKSLKSPSLTIYLNEDISQDKTKSQVILNQLELTKLSDILKSIKVYYDPDDYNTKIEEDRELLQIYKVFNDIDTELCKEDDGSKWIIRLEIDKTKMVNKDITMEMIYSKINLLFSNEISCVYSDDNSNKLIFRIRILKQNKNEATKINELNYIKNFIKNINSKVIIKGVIGIENISMFKNMDNYVYKNKSYIKQDEWVLDTKGINLLEIFQNNNIDIKRTLSNDIYEIYDLLGIEAARNVLLSEIREVIEGSGSYVNYRHLILLCDTMTFKGSLMSIDRFGINRATTGPLAKCSFEETTDQLFKASIFGELDKLQGVSSNIMMGQIVPGGTGNVNILLDESKLKEMYYEKEEELDDIETWEEKMDNCDFNVGIDYDISNLDADNNIGMPVVKIN